MHYDVNNIKKIFDFFILTPPPGDLSIGDLCLYLADKF